MAMTKCQECGGQVSTKAKACPGCGAELLPGRDFRGLVVGLILMAPILLLLNAVFSSPPKRHIEETKLAQPEPQPQIDDANKADFQKIENAKKQLAESLKDPIKRRYIECMGVRTYDIFPSGWKSPTFEECVEIGATLQRESRLRTQASGTYDVRKEIEFVNSEAGKCKSWDGKDKTVEFECINVEASKSDLRAQGYCYGPDDQPEAAKQWIKCNRTPSPAQLRPGRPAIEPPTINSPAENDLVLPENDQQTSAKRIDEKISNAMSNP